MKRILLSTLLIGWLIMATAATTDTYTVVVSLDGCRWDYPSWYHTPFFDHMGDKGVKGSLIPSFPSKTFPNHYTLATGLYPEHHGLIANEFMDCETGYDFTLSDRIIKNEPKFYGGEPIWLTAQRQGIKAAVIYWPGSDVKISGQYPYIHQDYDQKPRLDLEQRANKVVEFLKRPKGKRPRLIMVYMDEPDRSGHYYGPQASQTRQAVERMDSLMGNLYSRISQLPIGARVNFIVLSDHGMTWVDHRHTIALRPLLGDSLQYKPYGSVPVNIYATSLDMNRHEADIDTICRRLQGVSHLRAWRKEQVPAYLHYSEHGCIGDVVALPDPGWIVIDRQVPSGGMHGYDPTYTDMWAMFRAIGPAFKPTAMEPFRNVDVYPLLCRLLGIKAAPNDGEINEVKDMLAPAE